MTRSEKHHFDNVRRSVKMAQFHMDEPMRPGWRNRLAQFLSSHPKSGVVESGVAFLSKEYGLTR